MRRLDQKLVILKQIPVEQMTKDERLAAQNECQVLKLLHHPHIIEYYENFLEDKALMIAMEYAPGRGARGHHRRPPSFEGEGGFPRQRVETPVQCGLSQKPPGLEGEGGLVCQRVEPWVKWAGANSWRWAPPGLKMEGKLPHSRTDP